MVEQALIFGLAGMALGAFGATLFLRKIAVDCRSKLDCLDRYIKPSKLLRIESEDDPGTMVESASPLEASINEAVRQNSSGPMIRTRVLVEVPVADPAMKKELLSLRDRGDGQWLAIGIERMLRDPRLNRDMLDLKRRTVPSGWNLSGIEPAYDTGSGLMIWFEIERPIAGLKELHKAA